MNNVVSTDKNRPGRRKFLFITSIFFIVMLIVAAGVYLLYQSNTSSAINKNEYQAVFFTNGQVYFGKLQNFDSDTLTLTDIFYLQAPPTTTSSNPQPTSSASDVQLVKLGNEVHGPEDQMVINKSQILFYENLSKTGKVSDSITKYQQSKK